MRDKDDPTQCSILVTGDELVELKRHAHEIPECPGLDRRIQKYNGKGSLKLTHDELDWLVAVLDAVLHFPEGYPCVKYEPFEVEYVPTTDPRCLACQRLHDRLDEESERLHEIARKEWSKLKKREEARDRKQAEREQGDLPLTQIKAVFQRRKCPAMVARLSRGYTIYYEGAAISRIRRRDKYWEVLWWSHRDKWESIGDFGGAIFDTVEEAAEFVLDDPMDMFW